VLTQIEVDNLGIHRERAEVRLEEPSGHRPPGPPWHKHHRRPLPLHSLAAHELAHVIRQRRASTVARDAWLAGYLILVAAGAGLTSTAMLTAQHLAGPALPC